LTAVEIVLVPLFIVLCDTPQLASPAALLPLILLANIGLAAVGTLLSAVTARIGRDNLLAILVLPLVTPVLVAAAEASRLVMDGDFGPLWSAWMRLLVSFGVIFVTAGAVLFEFVLED
jgi:heme exporter protein B